MVKPIAKFLTTSNTSMSLQPSNGDIFLSNFYHKRYCLFWILPTSHSIGSNTSTRYFVFYLHEQCVTTNNYITHFFSDTQVHNCNDQNVIVRKLNKNEIIDTITWYPNLFTLNICEIHCCCCCCVCVCVCVCYWAEI